jgi:hypothetical protein
MHFTNKKTGVTLTFNQIQELWYKVCLKTTSNGFWINVLFANFNSETRLNQWQNLLLLANA